MWFEGMLAEKILVALVFWAGGCLLAIWKRRNDYNDLDAYSAQFNCSWSVNAIVYAASVAGACVGYRLGELFDLWLIDPTWQSEGLRLINAWVFETVTTFVFFAIVLRQQLNSLMKQPLPGVSRWRKMP